MAKGITTDAWEEVKEDMKKKIGYVVEGSTGGKKADGGKKDWTLMAWDVLEEVVDIMTRGAKKYAPFNWQKLPKRRVQAATIRHLVADLLGEEMDSEWNTPHLAHALCELIYWRWMEKHEVNNPE